MFVRILCNRWVRRGRGPTKDCGVIPSEANFVNELEVMSWILGGDYLDEKEMKKVCEAGRKRVPESPMLGITLEL